MTLRHVTSVVFGVSSFCLGIWIDRKYRDYNVSFRVPGFKIFDAVYAESNVNNNQQLIIKNEQRISQVRLITYAHIVLLIFCYISCNVLSEHVVTI